jgi:23S rRNA (guanosine2251-2'-O)-methyltransferase
MAKVKNRRDNHDTKRGRYYAARGMEMPGKDGAGRREGGRDGRGQGADRAARGERSARPAARRESFDPFEKNDRFGEPDPNVIIGRNPVTEILKNDRPVDKLMVSSREGSMIKIVAMAKEKSIPVISVEKAALDRIAGGRPHQGVVAYVSPYEYAEMEDIFALAEERGEDPFIIILDNLEDPHNLGALIRSAEAAGAHGIIIPKRRAVGLTWTVGKASAGAVEYLPVVRVANMTATVEELKARGVWVYAADMDGEPWCQANLTGAVALVVGGENHGVGRLVKEKCDGVLSLPMCGKVNSLNASVAGGILMYEIARQRLGLKAR